MSHSWQALSPVLAARAAIVVSSEGVASFVDAYFAPTNEIRGFDLERASCP